MTNVPPLLGCQYRFFGGCIRFDDTATLTPRIHENSGHVCAGLDSLEVMADGDLRIHFTDADPVISGFVNPDERFSLTGWGVGFSGGNQYVNLRFYKGGIYYPCTNSNLYHSNNNLWVGFFKIPAVTAAELDLDA